MTNEDLWNSYKEQTQTLSEICRKLAFAASGLCWIFKTSIATFPSAVRFALAFIVMFFLFDILQFLVGATILRRWTRAGEKKKWKENQSIEGDYEKPEWIDIPAFTLWWVKIIALLAAYACLGVHIIRMN